MTAIRIRGVNVPLEHNGMHMACKVPGLDGSVMVYRGTDGVYASVELELPKSGDGPGGIVKFESYGQQDVQAAVDDSVAWLQRAAKLMSAEET